MIGMLKLKKQVMKQIKTFLIQRKRGDDMKHCSLPSPPGCGNTMVGKLLYKVWISVGYTSQENYT